MVSLDYIAGFFDGEGCMTFAIDRFMCSVSPLITITNKDKAVLEEIQQTLFTKLGVRTRLYTPKESLAVGKCCYLNITGYRNIIGFLTPLLPLLHVKKTQAKYLVQYIESRLSKSKWSKQPRQPRTTEELNLIKLFFEANPRQTRSKTYRRVVELINNPERTIPRS